MIQREYGVDPWGLTYGQWCTAMQVRADRLEQENGDAMRSVADRMTRVTKYREARARAIEDFVNG